MGNDGIDRFEEELLRDLAQTIKEADRAVHSALLHRHWSHLHPISTAPFNQDLEVRVIDNGEAIRLSFPCRHTNDGRWINVDLGTHIEIEPVGWRVWQNSKSPEPHHSPVKMQERSALPHSGSGTGGKRNSAKPE
jgi:hypothetical protein